MTTTWLDAPGSTLSSRSDAIDFEVSADPAFVSVRFGDGRATETAYQDGVFLYPYLGSTKSVGNRFALRRTGGWPRDATVHVQEGAAKAAAFTPVDPTAWGQWTLSKQGGGGANRVPGRSAVYLNWAPDADQGWAPDLVPGHATFRPWVSQQGVGSSFGGGAGPRSPGIQQGPDIGTGPHTLAGRFFISAMPPSMSQVLLGIIGEYATARNAYAIFANGQIFMQRYGTGQTVGPSVDTLRWPSDGLWHYASVRFDATTIRFGVDGTFATVGAASSGGFFNGAIMVSVCRQIEGYQLNSGGGSVGLLPAYDGGWNAQVFWGGAADIGVWGRYLSDNEIRANASIALGKAL